MIALANKLAHIAAAVLARGRTYKPVRLSCCVRELARVRPKNGRGHARSHLRRIP